MEWTPIGVGGQGVWGGGSLAVMKAPEHEAISRSSQIFVVARPSRELQC